MEAKGFVTNPNDPCVVSKMINGSQCIIVWHMRMILKFRNTTATHLAIAVSELPEYIIKHRTIPATGHAANVKNK